MHSDRLRAWRDDPEREGTRRYAAELLARCGPLVLDGVLYRLDDAGEIVAKRPAREDRTDQAVNDDDKAKSPAPDGDALDA